MNFVVVNIRSQRTVILLLVVCGCAIEGNEHPFGSVVMAKDCMACECLQSGISCCARYKIPKGYDEQNCISSLDQTTCVMKVVRKDDSATECTVDVSMGK